MATIKRVFIFLTCISSGLAVLFTLVALVTEKWVATDKALWIEGNLTLPNTVQYGLFQGYYSLQQPSQTTVDISMTCLFKENICAILCGKDQDQRSTLLRQLYENDETADQDSTYCPTVRRAVIFPTQSISTFATQQKDQKTFINAGVWISTVVFLVLSIAVGMVSSALAIWNTVSNPVEIYFSVFGLYIYNAVALGFTVIGMALWGIMHLSVMFYDVGIYFTLAGKMSSEKTAYLGYSFWLLIVPIILYVASIALLYARQYLLSKDPGHKMVQREDTADPAIYLY